MWSSEKSSYLSHVFFRRLEIVFSDHLDRRVTGGPNDDFVGHATK